MNNKEITSLAFKLFAIYLLAEAILLIPSFYGLYVSVQSWTNKPNDNWILILIIAVIVIAIVMAGLIWKLSNNVITRTTKPSDTGPTKTPNSINEFILFALGVYILAEALLNLPSALSSAYIEHNRPNNPDGVSILTILFIISDALMATLGASLILKKEGWVKLYYKLRTA